jgi:hypothetical protein
MSGIRQTGTCKGTCKSDRVETTYHMSLYVFALINVIIRLLFDLPITPHRHFLRVRGCSAAGSPCSLVNGPPSKVMLSHGISTSLKHTRCCIRPPPSARCDRLALPKLTTGLAYSTCALVSLPCTGRCRTHYEACASLAPVVETIIACLVQVEMSTSSSSTTCVAPPYFSRPQTLLTW